MFFAIFFRFSAFILAAFSGQYLWNSAKTVEFRQESRRKLQKKKATFLEIPVIWKIVKPPNEYFIYLIKDKFTMQEIRSLLDEAYKDYPSTNTKLGNKCCNEN